MYRRSATLIVGGVMTVALMFTGSAAASTVAGSNCVGAEGAANVTVVSLKNPPGYPLPSAIPSAGVITSWTYSLNGTIPGEEVVTEMLKVFAPAAVPGQLTVVGESSTRVLGGTTTSPARIPVQSGDLIGSALTITDEGGVEAGALFCKTEDPGDEIAKVAGAPTVGATVAPLATATGFQNPITVTVEPDADGDGYGDETQDKCPTDASTHEACPPPKVAPPPAAPITLSDSAAARKGLVTVSLTASAQATVTVGGSVKLGKGKSVKLSGGTQIVAPGSLAKFTVLFPAKLKTALKQTPKSKKLSLTLSASAPGATSTSLKVKLPGQEQPKPRHKSKG
jgi:hypothetical protein